MGSRAMVTRLAISGYRSLREIRGRAHGTQCRDRGQWQRQVEPLPCAKTAGATRLDMAFAVAMQEGRDGPPLKTQFAVIQARASRWAMAISTSDMISATSRRSGIASVRPFRAARLN